MDIGALLIVAALFIGIVGFIIKPLLEKEKSTKISEMDDTSHLLAERERLMTAIMELDFDKEIGKVPDDVYAEQSQDLRSRTIAVMKELDEKQPEIEVADETEDKSSRRSLDEIEKLIAARRSQKTSTKKETKFCSECGTKIQKGDRFCTSCGSAQ